MGPLVVPLFNRATDAALEKVAGSHLRPEVVQYIDSLRPSPNAVYSLVNAMGAGEYFGSNINGDYFPEAALIHKPDDWTGNALLDKVRAKDWAYGFPTFYYAHPYAHHRNKDATRAFGEVELAVWNDGMKRVELVTRCDKDKCLEFGGAQVWDKLKAGMFPDVSMGCKVPYDTCSICLDWKLYREAQSTFIPGKHKHPGEAVLAFHKNHKIRGLSITRADYCEHARKEMNRILPDGKKVFVYNDYPKFFDISFVFIGADRTAKTMMKIASSATQVAEEEHHAYGLAQASSRLAATERDDGEKTAEAFEDLVFDAAFGKNAKAKKGEITKDVSSNLGSKAIPELTARESDLPGDILDLLGRAPLESSLATSGGLGIVLRPREFQRIVLVNMGKRGLADEMDLAGQVFPRSEERTPMPLGSSDFLPALVRLLLPLLSARSAIAPALEGRLIISTMPALQEKKGSSSHSSPLLRKISAAYNSYRDQLMELVAHAQDLMGGSSASPTDFRKLSSASPEEVFSPLTVEYIQTAFLDERAPASTSTLA